MREVRKSLIDQDGGTGESVMLLLFPPEADRQTFFGSPILVFLDLAILDLIINQLNKFIILRSPLILR